MTTTLCPCRPQSSAGSQRSPSTVRVLVVVEGTTEFAFLTRLSRMLHQQDSSLPDLGQLEAEGKILFFPVGGSDHAIWTDRLVPLRLAEFHLFDRDTGLATQKHQQAVEQICQRPNCLAAITGKRHLENYLHPDAIFAARGLSVEFDDQSDVPERVACLAQVILDPRRDWDKLSARKRRQLKHRTKRWLCTAAVEQMTVEMLAERDPQGEVRSWLEAIGWLLEQAEM